MKKASKTPKKTASRGKRRARRKKNLFSDALRAFLLVGIITVFSAAVSLAIINIHSRLKNTPEKITEGETAAALENTAAQSDYIDDKNVITVTETPKPVIQISEPEKSPAREQTARETVSAQPARSTQPAPVEPLRTTPVSSNSTPSSNVPLPAAAVPVSSAAQRQIQNAGTLVFVIDDAGNNLRELEPFLRIPGPLTIAVLPGLPYSAEAARRIRAAGKEVILHQPMEAIGAQNPGPGAIYSGMSEAEVRAVLSRNIADIGPVAGMNNHQGSKISMDNEITEIVLAFCAERGIFFLDSRTTAETVFPYHAQRLGMKIAQRDVFLDNEQDKSSMLRYITSGLSMAQRNGSAVMIGHVWSPELAPLLDEQFPVLTIQGYTIKTVSEIIK